MAEQELVGLVIQLDSGRPATALNETLLMGLHA